MSCLGREIWLQVLLSLEAEALTAVACCQGHHLPALCELAAWLRSGLPRAEEVLGVKIGLPSRCHSWVQLLYQQMQGTWFRAKGVSWPRCLAMHRPGWSGGGAGVRHA